MKYAQDSVVWGSYETVRHITKNIREDELNPRLGYDMVRIENIQNTSTRGVIGYITVWITMCSELLNWIELKIQLNEFETFIWVYND